MGVALVIPVVKTHAGTGARDRLQHVDHGIGSTAQCSNGQLLAGRLCKQLLQLLCRSFWAHRQNLGHRPSQPYFCCQDRLGGRSFKVEEVITVQL